MSWKEDVDLLLHPSLNVIIKLTNDSEASTWTNLTNSLTIPLRAATVRRHDLLQADGEYRVRPRAGRVHQRCRHNAIARAGHQQPFAVGGRVHGVLRQIRHRHALAGQLLQLQQRAGRRRLQQIAHLLVVDLQVAALGQIATAGGHRDRLEDVIERALNDAALRGRRRLCGVRPLHRVRLAAAGLAVREDGAVVAVEDVVDERVAQVVVQRFGAGGAGVRRVEGERFGRSGRIGAVGEMDGTVVDADDVLDGWSGEIGYVFGFSWFFWLIDNRFIDYSFLFLSNRINLYFLHLSGISI